METTEEHTAEVLAGLTAKGSWVVAATAVGVRASAAVDLRAGTMVVVIEEWVRRAVVSATEETAAAQWASGMEVARGAVEKEGQAQTAAMEIAVVVTGEMEGADPGAAYQAMGASAVRVRAAEAAAVIRSPQGGPQRGRLRACCRALLATCIGPNCHRRNRSGKNTAADRDFAVHSRQRRALRTRAANPLCARALTNG